VGRIHAAKRSAIMRIVPFRSMSPPDVTTTPAFAAHRGRGMIPVMRRTTVLGAGALALGALGVAAAVAAGLAVRRARLEPMLVNGGSMRPTLDPGQRIAVAPLVRPPRRGDLVVLARSQDLEVVKRVVGLPGERVRLAAGRLEVDGTPVPEPYLHGDPRAASTDGRDFGPVGADALLGLVRFAYWPPRRLRRGG
jgi:signal peptidase I